MLKLCTAFCPINLILKVRHCVCNMTGVCKSYLPYYHSRYVGKVTETKETHLSNLKTTNKVNIRITWGHENTPRKKKTIKEENF